MEGVTSFASEAYRESISGWTRDGLAKHAREGHATGTPPFGYRLAKLHPQREKSPKVLVIDPAQAEIAQHIFTLSA